MRAIGALLESGTISEAAEKVKVNRKTLARWMKEVDFLEALQDARQQFLRHHTSRICGLLGRAVDVIADALDRQDVDRSSFLSARFIIETAMAIQAEDLDARVTQLERRVAEDRDREQRRYDQMSDEQIKSRMRSLLPKVYDFLDGDVPMPPDLKEIRAAIDRRIAEGDDK